MNLVGVTICKAPGEWAMPEIPHLFFTRGFKEIPESTAKNKARIEYLSERRRQAHDEAIKCFPHMTHFFDVDGYYTNQGAALRHLVRVYLEINNPDVILGGATWMQYRDLFRVLGYKNPFRKFHFWDTWTTPEAENLSIHELGIKRVSAVGGIVIYPVSAFLTNGFGPRFFPLGSEYNQLCEGYDTRLCLTTSFVHPTPANLRYRKRLRILLGGLLH
jgi:hypothetical protein